MKSSFVQPMEINRQMNQTCQGVIFDIKHYAIHDGPGIRTTVFLKGCPLTCLWCANPESQKIAPEIMFDPVLCQQCRACEQACPVGAIRFNDDLRVHDRTACTGCGKCAAVCESGALELCGRNIDARTLWEEIKTDRAFWDRSGGGVTLSGGEPLLQQDFTLEFLALCKSHRVHTAVETCGHVPKTVFNRVAGLADLVLFDFKLADTAAHKSNTGVSNEQIAANLNTLIKSPGDKLIRIPVIPGINDVPAEFEKIGVFLGRAAPGINIELLPYHRLGEKKYEKLGKEYPLNGLAPPDSAQMASLGKSLAGYGLSPILP